MARKSYSDPCPDENDGSQHLLQKLGCMNAGALGGGGSIRVTDTTLRSGINCFCIVPQTDTVFTTLTGNCTGGTGVTWKAGIPVWGLFTAVQLTSGDATLYLLP